MIVADTSALISLATADVLRLVLEEFDVHTTETVVTELEDTAEHTDVHGEAAETVLELLDQITIHGSQEQSFESSRIDRGEGSCSRLSQGLDAEFLLTDDLRALPELQILTDARVAISPIVLRALVKRGVFTNEDAVAILERVAERRDWHDAPIYRRALDLFE
ncbi:hypothetical protein [Halegenticoccus soli]|uniref:hypothetical protein n=1 Tax=Halegenticoccus soli TaxID=1985678 RepID=UPI000C6D7C1B|nr:hypothetical protein [Halegenticoccus soli]